MVMPPYHGATFRVGEAQIHDFYATLSDALRIPIMIQDAPVAHTDVARLPGAHGPEIEQVSYFKMETAGAAAKRASSSSWAARPSKARGTARKGSRCWPTWTLAPPDP